MADKKQPLVEWLYATYGAAVYAFISRRVRDRAEAADLAQEVFLRLLRAPDLEAIRDPHAYVITVARNLMREHWLRKRRLQASVDVDDPAVQEELCEFPVFAEQLDTEQRRKRLREVLRQLPAKCQAAVVMHYRGMTYEQIGPQLGVSTNMVKKYLSQAIAHCRRRMGRLR